MAKKKSDKTVTGLSVSEQQTLAMDLGISLMELKGAFAASGAAPSGGIGMVTMAIRDQLNTPAPSPSPSPSTPNQGDLAGLFGSTPTPTPSGVPFSPASPPPPDPYNPDLSSGIQGIDPASVSNAMGIAQTIRDLLGQQIENLPPVVRGQIVQEAAAIYDDGYITLDEQMGLRGILQEIAQDNDNFNFSPAETNAIIDTIKDVAYASPNITDVGPNSEITGMDVRDELDEHLDFSGLVEAIQDGYGINPNNNPQTPGGGDGDGDGDGDQTSNNNNNNGGGGGGTFPKPYQVIDPDPGKDDYHDFTENFGDYVNEIQMKTEKYYDKLMDAFKGPKLLMIDETDKFEAKFETQMTKLMNLKDTYDMSPPSFMDYKDSFNAIDRIYNTSISAFEAKTGLAYDKGSRKKRSEERISRIGDKDIKFGMLRQEGQNLIAMYML